MSFSLWENSQRYIQMLKGNKLSSLEKMRRGLGSACRRRESDNLGWRGCGKRGNVFGAGGSKNQGNHCVKVSQKTKNRNITLPSHTALEHTILEHYTLHTFTTQLECLQSCHMTQIYHLLLESSWHRNACSSIFTAALFTGDWKWNQPGDPSTDEQRMWFTYTVKFPAATKQKNFVKSDSRDTNAACFLSHAEPSFKTVPVTIYI